MGIEHENYRQSLDPVPATTREALIADFA
jgi:hypothetical protein